MHDTLGNIIAIFGLCLLHRALRRILRRLLNSGRHVEQDAETGSLSNFAFDGD